MQSINQSMDEYAITIENYNRKRSEIRRNLRREMKKFKGNFDIIIKQLKKKNACYIYYNHYEENDYDDKENDYDDEENEEKDDEENEEKDDEIDYDDEEKDDEIDYVSIEAIKPCLLTSIPQFEQLDELLGEAIGLDEDYKDEDYYKDSILGYCMGKARKQGIILSFNIDDDILVNYNDICMY
jgi:hypothetical protein